MKKSNLLIIVGALILATAVGVFCYIQQKRQAEQYEQAVNAYLEKYHTIHFENQLAKLTPKDLGVEFVEPNLIEINQENLEKTLEQKFQLSEIEPKSATFYNENSEIKITPAKPGLEPNMDQFYLELKTAAKNLETADIFLETTPANPTVETAQLEAQKDQVLAKLEQKITLIDPIYSDGWTIKLADHLDWVEFKATKTISTPLIDFKIADDQGPEISLAIKQESLDQYINENISKWLDKPATSTKITLDQNKKIQISGEGKDGLSVQRKNLKAAIELAVNNGISSLDIPVYKELAALEIAPEIQAMGIKERIGQGHTTFYGSPANRTHNIKVAAANFNGLLIQPGEEFSFNTNLGAVDASTGYRKELVIKQEGTIPEYGGGVCQVSTTMYRAALFSGIDITSRRAHSYAVSYYSQVLGHGLDATIYLGGQDLKFKNDTNTPILVHTYIDKDYELYVNFYGTADGRKVELAGPHIFNQRGPGATQYIDTPDLPLGQTKQMEKAHGGFSVDWNYKLYNKEGQLTKEETIESRYKSVPAKILVGTGASNPL